MTATVLALRLRPVAVPAVAVVSVACTLTGLVFAFTRPTVENLVQGHLLGDAATALAATVVGALILGRIPRQPVGMLFAGVGAADGIALLASGVQSARPADVTALWAAACTWQPGLGLLALLPLVVPDGARRRWERVVLAAGLAGITVWTIGSATRARLATGPDVSVPNPFAVPGGDLLITIGITLGIAVALAGLGALVARTVTADPDRRRRLLPFLGAGVVVLVAVGIAPALGLAGVVLQDAALLLVPVACLVSVLRLRLYGLEVAIGRSVAWVALTAALVGGYTAVVLLAGRLFRLPELPSSVVATALVALAFAPLRAALQATVSRWLYGARGDPAAALQATTRLLAEHPDPNDALERAVEAIGHALRSPGARIVRGGAVLAGVNGGTAAIAVLAAVAARDDLRAARGAMAVAREEERRRVREQLHDDVGPGLAAAAVQTQTALKRLQRDDPDGAADALAAVAVTVRRASADLRTALDALGPRALDELGLADAIEDLLHGIRGEALSADLDVTALPPLSPAVQATAYRIVAESLTNVLRHSGAARVRVTLRAEPGGPAEPAGLVVIVADDGRAARLERPGGLGIASMRARAEELGGSLTVTRADPEGGTGTTVTARLPLTAPSRVDP